MSSLVDFVVSLNMTRRHLTEPQRASVAANIATLGRGGSGSNQYSRGKRSDDPLALSQSQAAQLMGISVESVKRASVVKHEAEEAAKERKLSTLKKGPEKPVKQPVADREVNASARQSRVTEAKAAAKIMSVSVRQVGRASVVKRKGIPEDQQGAIFLELQEAADSHEAKLKREAEEAAKQRQLSTLKRGPEKPVRQPVAERETKSEERRSRTVEAKAAGVSHETLRRLRELPREKRKEVAA